MSRVAPGIAPAARERPYASPAVIAALVAGCGMLMTAFALMSWQPVSADEGDFYLAAAEWLSYRSVIPHPQLYVHSMQAMFALLGQTVTSARSVNLIATLLTALLLPWLTFLVFAQSLDRPAVRRAQVLAVVAWALCPLVAQNTMLIDIDNGVLTTAIVLLACVWLATAGARVWVRALATGAAFGLALGFKLATPPMLIFAFLIHAVLRKEWRTAAAAGAAAVIGVGLFVAGHSVYSGFTGWTLRDSISAFLWRSGNETGILSGMATVFPQSTGVFLFWLGLPMGLLLTGVFFESLQRLARRRLQQQDMLVIFVLEVFVFYGALLVPPWGYPRYHTPGLAMVFVLVAGFLAPRMSGLTRRCWLFLASIGIAAAVLQWLLTGDSLFDLYRATFESVSLLDRLRVAGGSLVKLGAITGLAAVLAAFSAPRLGRRRGEWIAVALGAAALGGYAALNVTQIPAPYSTRYRYTYVYADRQRAIDLVKAATPRRGFILADRDVLWYSDRPGKLVYEYLNPAALYEVLNTQHVDAIVWTEKEWLKSTLRDSGSSGASLLQRCYPQSTFGIFTVALRDPACTDLP